MADNLKKKVQEFRVTQLQALLTYAGRSKHGKKNDLMRRAMNLFENGECSAAVAYKINLLSKKSSNTSPSRHRLPIAPSPPSRLRSSHSTYVECPLNPPPPTSSSRGSQDSTSVLPSTVPSHLAPSSSLQPSNTISMSRGSSTQLPPLSSRYHLQSSVLPQLLVAQSSMSPASDVFSNFSLPPVGFGRLPNELPSASSTCSPIHPDVRLKYLPFYEIKHELLKPSSLSAVSNTSTGKNSHRACFQFSLTPLQVEEIVSSRNELLNDDCGIIEYGMQIQLRFCLAETTCEQEDNFPPNVTVRVNYQDIVLPNLIPSNKPGVDPKRPGRPVNITPAAQLSSTVQNMITVYWTSDPLSRSYCIAVNVVKQLTSADLMARLKQNALRHPDHTRALVKEKLAQSSDSEISTTSLRISLICPLSKTRMVVPCRPSSCKHLQCFDAATFLQMNEKRSKWLCPVCDKPAEYDALIVDGLFTEILYKARDSNDIQFSANGLWSPLKQKDDKKCQSSDLDNSIAIETIPDSPVEVKQVDCIDLTETDDEIEARPSSLSSGSPELTVLSSLPAQNLLTGSAGAHVNLDPLQLSSQLAGNITRFSSFLSALPHAAGSSEDISSDDVHAVIRSHTSDRQFPVEVSYRNMFGLLNRVDDSVPSPAVPSPITSRTSSTASSEATLPVDAADNNSRDSPDIIMLD